MVRIDNDPVALGGGDRQGRRGPGGGAGGDLRLVLGGRRAGRGRRAGASGASVGGQGFRVPAGEERRARRRAIWRICCGWAGCPRRGSPRRRCGSCGSWCGTGPSWSRCAAGLKAQVHAVLAKQGVHVPVTDLFGVGGHRAARRAGCPDAPYRGAGRLAAPADRRARLRDRRVRRAGPAPAGPRPRVPGGPGHPRGRAGAGRGVRRRDRRGEPVRPARAAVLVGRADAHGTASPTPRCTAGRITKQGSRLVRWAAVEAVQILPKTSWWAGSGTGSASVAGRNIGVVAAARRQLRTRLLRPARPPGPRTAGHQTGGGMKRRHPNSWPVRVVQVMTPTRGVVAPSD